MRTIEDYVQIAIRNKNFSSNNKLAEALGLSHASLSRWLNGKSWPDDASMIKLCQLAGIDPAIGLMDLNAWRSPASVKTYYSKILEKITAAIIILILFLPHQSQAKALTLLDNLQGINFAKEQVGTNSFDISSNIHYHIRNFVKLIINPFILHLKHMVAFVI